MDIVKPKMTMDRAARRYSQIAGIECTVRLLEDQIADQRKVVDEAEEALDELRKKRATLLVDMRAAARDEGDLPLIMLSEVSED